MVWVSVRVMVMVINVLCKVMVMIMTRNNPAHKLMSIYAAKRIVENLHRDRRKWLAWRRAAVSAVATLDIAIS